MKTVGIRVDGAPFMGSGHIMRCLTLAEGLRNRGAEVHFVARDFPDHFGGFIKESGFLLHLLPFINQKRAPVDDTLSPSHANWLGTSWEEDAQQTKTALSGAGIENFDLLIVDHYALDARWHKEMRSAADKIFAIDDLADRPLDCDFLLDQTFMRRPEDYAPFVSGHCEILCGSEYMLLRPAFESLRPRALEKRRHYKGPVRNIFICMGSADPENLTQTILEGLESIAEPLNISIIISSKAPHLEAIRQLVHNSVHKISLHIDSDTVHEEMIKADIAFGAGGTMSWERCCLGLPTFLTILAENQELIAENLEKAGAIINLGPKETLTFEIVHEAMIQANLAPEKILNVSQNAARICDGKGLSRVLEIIGKI